MRMSDLVESIANDSGISKAAAGRALDSLLSNVTKELKKSGHVSIAGFGKFSISNRAARAGRNPRTGEPITIKATKAPKFHAGKGLKEAIK